MRLWPTRNNSVHCDPVQPVAASGVASPAVSSTDGQPNPTTCQNPTCQNPTCPNRTAERSATCQNGTTEQSAQNSTTLRRDLRRHAALGAAFEAGRQAMKWIGMGIRKVLGVGEE